MAKQKKEINMVFLDNKELLTKNQLEYFAGYLSKIQENNSNKMMSAITISSIKENKFFLEIDNQVKINFIGETLVVDFESDSMEQLDSESILKIDLLTKKNELYPTLYIVDLHLDTLDQNERTGEVVGDILMQKCQGNGDVLYMSGHINFWRGRYPSEECWFVYRACIEDKMNEGFKASAASPYTCVLMEKLEQRDPIFELIKCLLCSEYYNGQYLGVVLLKAYILLKNQ